MEQP
jgi:hypothetical protein